MTEPADLVPIQLRELRAEMKADREALSAEIKKLEIEMTRRLDAMHLNGVKALRGFIGHRAMERFMASIDEELARLREPVERLEGAPT
jgi:predicted aspartyl protease